MFNLTINKIFYKFYKLTDSFVPEFNTIALSAFIRELAICKI